MIQTHIVVQADDFTDDDEVTSTDSEVSEYTTSDCDADQEYTTDDYTIEDTFCPALGEESIQY